MTEINKEALNDELLDEDMLEDEELDDVSGGAGPYGDGTKQLITYTIVPRDTLIRIARKYNTTWKLIQKQNPVTCKEPKKIRPGMVIKFYANNH